MICHQQTKWQFHHCTRKRQLYIPPSHRPPARQQYHSTRERIPTQLLVPARLSSQRTGGITIRKYHQRWNGHVGNSQMNPVQQGSGALGAKTTEQEIKEVRFPRLRNHFRSSPRKGCTGPRQHRTTIPENVHVPRWTHRKNDKENAPQAQSPSSCPGNEHCARTTLGTR